MRKILPTMVLLMLTVLVACGGGQSTFDPKSAYMRQPSPTPVEVAPATPASLPPSPTTSSLPGNTPTQTAGENLYLLYFYADW